MCLYGTILCCHKYRHIEKKKIPKVLKISALGNIFIYGEDGIRKHFVTAKMPIFPAFADFMTIL
jgi:hypothetical protein